ncbi:DegV family protein [Mycoplasma sp. SG1]|uniref:DegV family protein n=1 Tax=Mycoplasma sp. SG1 TaxID=2810348 RepID=UPI002024B292|nr:DegV family protein [Mycoplasma sp. SG1]URM53102.1 DegV family protein [Mycoplasma sp. SG1]
MTAKKPYIILTDSSALLHDQKSKLLVKQLNLDFFYLHLHYQENDVWKSIVLDENFNENNYLKLYETKCDFKTAQPSPSDFINKIIDLLEKYEKIYIFVLSKFISGTHNTLSNLIQKNNWKDKVILFDSVNISAGLLSYSNLLNNQLKNYSFNLKQFSKFLSVHQKYRFWIVIPNDFSYLKRSGRMSVAASSIVAMFRIKCSLLFEKKAEKLVIAHNLNKVFVKTFSWAGEQFESKKINSANISIVVLVCFVNEVKIKSCIHTLKKYFPNATIEVKPMSILFAVYNGVDSIVIYFEANPEIFFNKKELLQLIS